MIAHVRTVTNYQVVAYRRPSLGKLEIHTLDNDVARLVRVRAGTEQSVQHRNVASHFSSDPTCPRPQRQAAATFDQRTVHQVLRSSSPFIMQFAGLTVRR